MLKVISAAILAAQLFPTVPLQIDRSDAQARAAGNRKDIAVQIGRAIFRTRWPAQVLTVYADGVGGHAVAGLRISGRHFHAALTRNAFIAEIADLVRATFAASAVEEVDVWTVMPLRVGKDIVVTGDLARPSSRTVFTLSALRNESAAALEKRMRAADGVYWDQEWERSALKVSGR
ncbi:MAG TPA: hypothetical protein VGR69_03175 [Candidatus Rubrimentiphilum sp.]|nr:hypothetical protein [Candidatus Rubrimentiphilum sp.]